MANDLVYTPHQLAKDIIDHFKPSGRILEPCRGKGAFYDNFPSGCDKFWCEIEDGKDFFDFNEKVDWIITNPPWSKIKSFLSHSMTISDNIVFLMLPGFLMTKYRQRLIRDSGFWIKEVYAVPTPKSWASTGFVLAAIHLQKGHGKTYFDLDNI